MVACDFDLNFTFVSCGWEGSASDAGVLRSAISKGFSVLEGKFYLVDTNSLDLDGQETTSVFNLSSDAQSVPVNTNEPTEAQFVPSNQESSQREGGSGRKRKQSHVGLALESYMEFKKIQNTETLETLKEHKRQEDQFSISKCQVELKGMDGLTTMNKSYALELFVSATNREIFLTTTEHDVRKIWLKRKIRYAIT
jgi:hypothetical protein